MHPNKVCREIFSNSTATLTDLPNVGKAVADDFRVLGCHQPVQLLGRCPFELYDLLCVKTGIRHDPCMIDVFISVTRFLAGEEARPWWFYTAERKRILAQMGR